MRALSDNLNYETCIAFADSKSTRSVKCRPVLTVDVQFSSARCVTAATEEWRGDSTQPFGTTWSLARKHKQSARLRRRIGYLYDVNVKGTACYQQ